MEFDADNWMLALRCCLDALQIDRDVVKMATFEIQADNVIHVTEPESSRVFIIDRVRSFETTEGAVTTDRTSMPPSSTQAGWQRPRAPRRTISHLDLASIRREHPRLFESDAPSTAPTRSVSVVPGDDRLLASLFERLGDLSLESDSIEGALQFALELVMEMIPSAAGWILLADKDRRDLYVAMASGPKSDEVIRYRLPYGRGIAGQCAIEGKSLALTDVRHEPQYQTSLYRSIRLNVVSAASAPLAHDGQIYGVFQLTNHLGRAHYLDRELEALTYVAQRVAEYLVNYAVVEAVN